MTGAERIAAERQRQIEAEGFTASQDDQHASGELAAAAATYIRHGSEFSVKPLSVPNEWPWDGAWWKPADDPIRNLEKAGALIAAEIDRILRERGQT